VNYTFFGKKARIAKKKLKESLRQKKREKAEKRKRTINLNSINQKTDAADKNTENGQVRRRQAENKIETKRKFF